MRDGSLTRPLANPGAATAWRGGQAGAAAAIRTQLALAWMTLAVVALALSTIWAVVLVLARMPLVAPALPAAQVFPTALALHVNLAVQIWFLAFGAGLWTLVARRVWRPLAWAGFGLAAAGVLSVSASPLLGRATVFAANYIPVVDNAAFLVGLAWFAIAALAAAAGAAASLVTAGRSADGVDAVLALAALPVLLAAGSAAWSLAAVPPQMSPGLYYELVTWGPGHLLQFGFTTLLLAAWLWLARGGGIATAATAPLAWWSAVLTVAPAFAGLLLHGLYAPDTVAFRKGFTLLMSYGAWPGVLPLAVHLAWRLAVAPGSRRGRSALALSLLLFALGCVLGAFIRTDNTMVPAHYHGTVGAITLAFMALAQHWLTQQGFRHERPRLAASQPWLYGGGLLLLVVGLAWAGGHGAPRKMPLAGEPVGNAVLQAAHGLAGAGGLLAIAGAGMFVALVLAALGRRPVPTEPAPESAAVVAAAGPPHRDARPRALALTVGGILFLGLLIGYAPGEYSPRRLADGLLARHAAVDAASHVVERRQAELDARFAQGVAMLQAGRYDHAATAFHRVLELDPRLPEAHVNLGFALLGLGDARAALDFFESATELRREQVNAYYGMAVALEALGDLPAAIGAMRSYLHRAAPDDAYQRKARAALWEWEEEMKRRKAMAGGKGGGEPGKRS